MNSVFALVFLAFVGSSISLPLAGKDIGVDLVTGDLNSWKKDFVLAGQTISLGAGWKNDGTITATGGVVANIDGNIIPLSAGIATNIHSPKKVQYQVGTQILNTITGILSGSTDGALKYVINAWPIVVKKDGRGVAIGVGLEGDHLKPVKAGAAVGSGNEVAQLVIGLGKDLIPDSVDVAVSGNTADV